MTTTDNRISAWLACPECEAPCLDRQLPKKAELRCTRCGVRVKIASGRHSLQPAWAFATAGLFVAILANVEPIMTFDVAGDTQSNHIVSGVIELARQGYGPVAALVCFAGVIAPVLHLTAIWYVASACCLRRRWPAVHRVAVLIEMLEPWNLVPVYAIATVVAVVKLDMMGTVDWKAGALWILVLSLCSLCAAEAFDRELVEERLEALK
ncbi:MAG: paraquat-inducible protein A [Verrucomicrobiaceae bacterium]|nr:MAG: paraquat-inducible protein A [Verrucomicrobiaceae bacterium]